MEDKNLPGIPPESKPPSVSKQVVDEIIELSEDVCMSVTVEKDGFRFKNQDKLVPELVGRIRSIVNYIAYFPGGGQAPIKKPWVKYDVDIPEDFKRRADVIMGINGQLVSIRLSPTSIKYQLGPYLKHLRNQGLEPEDVITRCTTRTASNELGSWAVVVFEVADEKRVPSEPPSKQKDFDFPSEWD